MSKKKEFHKIYHIICEGETEEEYLSKLNIYIRDELLLNFSFKSHNLKGFSSYNQVKKQYKKIRKEQKKPEIFIWLDNDVFERKQKSKEKLQEELYGFSNIKYNYHNGEDFLVMHLPDKQVQDWHNICKKNKHFDTPMTADNVNSLIQSIIPSYNKGYLPKEIQITEDTLERLYQNHKNKNVEFRSDFAELIKKLSIISN